VLMFAVDRPEVVLPELTVHHARVVRDRS
jgi:hypothetical protein